jgi:hypothetical protein
VLCWATCEGVNVCCDIFLSVCCLLFTVYTDRQCCETVNVDMLCRSGGLRGIWVDVYVDVD